MKYYYDKKNSNLGDLGFRIVWPLEVWIGIEHWLGSWIIRSIYWNEQEFREKSDNIAFFKYPLLKILSLKKISFNSLTCVLHLVSLALHGLIWVMYEDLGPAIDQCCKS